jgi:hypothetical protein
MGGLAKLKNIKQMFHCWWHYPKNEIIIPIIISLILGPAIGLFLPLILNDPLKEFLSKYLLLHYLDNQQPIIEQIQPDILKSNSLDKEVKSFNILYSDKGTGLDYLKSKVILHKKQNNTYISIPGDLEINKDRLVFSIKDTVEYGSYILEIILTDKNNNTYRQNNHFIFPEKEDLQINIQKENYQPDKHGELFSSFIKKHGAGFSDADLYVYKLNISNKAKKIVIKSLNLTIDTSIIILKWVETGSAGVKGLNTVNIAESMNKTLTKERVFPCQQLLHIDEIAPYGIVIFSILVGKPNFEFPDFSINNVHIFGTYVIDGYEKTEIKELNLYQKIENK